MNIYIDIETIPDTLQTISQINNIMQKKYNQSDDDDWLINNGALYPEIGKIKAIGFGTETGKQIIEVGDEIDLLNKFTELCSQKQLYFIGRNIKRFDIPYIIKRYAINNMPVPDSLFGFARKKPRETNIIDLMEVRSGGSGRRDSLELCCLSLGLDNPKNSNHGDQVKNMSDNEIKEYLSKDIKAVYEIHQKFINLKII